MGNRLFSLAGVGVLGEFAARGALKTVASFGSGCVNGIFRSRWDRGAVVVPADQAFMRPIG
jgi:hypothetical protein